MTQVNCALHKVRGFFAVAALAGFMAFAPNPAAAVTVGEKAPDFTAKAADGSEVKLSDYAGKMVVLEWFNKDCPFVRKHYDSANMQTLQKEYAAKDVIWLTVNSSAEGKQGYETAEAALKTVETEDAAPAHVLLDSEGTLGKLYDAKTTPHMFVIDKEGTLVYAGAIDDTPSVKPEDVKTAKNYVRAALDAIAAGEKVAEASTKAYGCGVKYLD
jgi:peroxiredoxin